MANMKHKVALMAVHALQTREYYLDSYRQSKAKNYKLLADDFDKLAVKLADVVDDLSEIEQIQDETAF